MPNPDVTIGCDPEFLLLNPQNHIEHVNINHVDASGNIGYDHGGSVGELRPAFGSPQEVTINIKNQFIVLKKKFPTFKIVAGGGEKYGLSIGGHIHFGNIQFNSSYQSSTRQCNRGRVRPLLLNTTQKEHKLIYMLDYFIGRRLKKVAGGQRPNSATYGRLSDVETKNHGFEYRTPPSWISDPILTESTLTVAQRIAAIWKENPDFFDEIIRRNKNIARKKEYAVLIPDSGTQKEYVSKQIASFKKLTFSKTYRMDNDNCIDTWTLSPDQIVEVRNVSNKIKLEICQLKLLQQIDSMPSETVVKVCRFAVREVKIIAQSRPYHVHLRLKENTIYMNSDLRPYLKIKRGHEYRVKFISGIESNSVIFLDSRSSSNKILTEIIKIFETGARKKFRNHDNNLQVEESNVPPSIRVETLELPTSPPRRRSRSIEINPVARLLSNRMTGPSNGGFNL